MLHMNYEKLTKAELIKELKSLKSKLEVTDISGKSKGITEHKKTGEEIKGLARFPSENPNPVIRVLKDGNILYHNKASTFLLDFWDCQTSRTLPDNYIKIISDVLHSGLSSVAETECEDRVISLTFAPIIEEGYVNIYGMDVTKCKQAENALKESEKKALLMLNSTGEAIYGLDLEGNCNFCNSSCLRLLGFKDESQLLSRNMHNLIHHTKKDGTFYPEEDCCIYKAFREGKGTHVNDEVLWRADGTSFAAEYQSFPIFHEGETVGSVVSFIDITERTKAEEEIKGLAKFPSENPNPVMRVFKDGNILYHNKASTFLLDFWGCQTTGVLPDSYIKIVSDVLHSGVSSVTETECKNRIISLAFTPIMGEGYVNIYGMDITERKKAEDMLNTTNESLEKLVFERTKELKENNVKLKKEITEHKMTEEMLKKSEKSLVKAQEIARIGSWEWDVVKNESFCSDELYRIHGLLPQQYNITFEKFIKHVHPDDRVFVEKSVNAALYERKPYCIEFRIIDPNGQVHIVNSEAEVVHGEDGKPLKMIGIEQDITERKKAEETLIESEEKYHKLVESANDAIFVADVETGIIIDVNKRAEQMIGLPAEEIIGMHQTLLHQPEEAEHYRKIFEDHIQSGNAIVKDVFVCNKDGRKIPVEISASITELKGRKIIQGIFRDITERVKAEEELKKYKILFDNITDLAYICDTKGNILYLNNIFQRLSGYKPGEFIGKSFAPLFDEENLKKAIDLYTKTLKGESPKEEIYFKDTGLLCEYKNIPLRNNNGNIIGVIGIGRDITERKLAEEQNKAIISTAIDGFLILNTQGRILETNDAYCNLTGYSREELLKMSVYDVEALEKPEDTKKHIQLIIKTGGGRFESKHRCKDDRIIDIEVSTNFVNLEGGRFFSFIRDITERKQAEKLLFDSEERLKAFLENSAVIGWMKDENGRHVFLSKNYQSAFGVKFDDWKGKTDFELWPQEVAEKFRKNDLKVLSQGNTIEVVEMALLPDGSQSWWLNRKFLFIDSSARKYVGGLGVNITENKKAEKILQEQKKSLEQKNIALSEILGQIEIEKKQIKDNVITNAENLLLPVIQKLKLTGESRKYVQLLQKNLQELTSSFGTKLTEKEDKLTSREIEICNMIRSGLSNKEISGLLNISQGTTERHRANIRKKLGVINKDINLTSFLKRF